MKLKLTLAGVWGRSVLTELEEEQWDPVFVSVPDKRRFLDSGELDICKTPSYDVTHGFSINVVYLSNDTMIHY